MAVMELTLGGLKFANVYGFERDYGTKKTALVNGGSLTTKEFNEANALPFDLMRPTFINETTNILSVEYDAKLNLSAPSEITVTIGNGKYIGQTVTFINSSSVAHKIVINGTDAFISPKNRIIYEWYGDTWESEDARSIGTIKMYGGLVAPVGYFLCNGEEKSKSLYPALYAVIGDRFGTAVDTTKFKLPDWTDRVPQGASDTNTVGTKLEAGVPDITGQITNSAISEFNNASVTGATGAFKDAGTVLGYVPLGNTNYPQMVMATLKLSASKGETKINGTIKTGNEHHVYGNSDTVQSPAQTCNFIIKY